MFPRTSRRPAFGLGLTLAAMALAGCGSANDEPGTEPVPAAATGGASGSAGTGGTATPDPPSSGGTTGTSGGGAGAGAGGPTSGGTSGAPGGGLGGDPETGGAGAAGATPSGGAGGGGMATGGEATEQGGTDVGGSGGGQGGMDVGGGGSAGSGGAFAGASGAAGAGGLPPFPDQVDPPVSDQGSNLPVASPGGQYQVDGNIPYGDLPRQRLDVMYPRGGGPDAKSTLPGVIMFHGGGWIQGDKATMSSFYSRFLSHGFVVCSAEYRVADGTPDGGIAPAAVEDALLAAKWFWDYLDYYHVDRMRYVVTGASAGGHLALMVGMATAEAGLGPTHPTDYRIAAIVNGYGPPDVPDLLQRNVSFAVQWLPANTPNRNELAVQVSPITYVRADIPPLITVQGSNDTTVPVAENQHLDELLKAAGADADIHLVQGAGHGFSSPASAWPDAEMTMFDFLTAHGIIP